ncbi:RICIN domain-containing protein [Streptomyces sp. HUCO-GS316]|uniref:RICIN domain-containing protein n=1 Tax=Streptomyces sp. HUCO-GS316 TaxID=2692198 RepID=UPI0019256CF0|nr:hypothetical protein [Streptomyces sp. HUCO-GS316]
MRRQDDVPPGRARNADEFVQAMRQLKARSGLSYRKLEGKAAERGEVLARSTLADVLGGKVTPGPELLTLFVRACGDGDRVAEWLRAWERTTFAAGETAQSPGAAALLPPRSRRRTGPRSILLMAAALVLAACAGAGVLWSFGGDRPTSEKTGSAIDKASAVPGALDGPPGGWVRIRPVTAPGMCVTDGRVADRRYTPLVAVQRPCGEVAPQGTLLEPLGDGAFHIQWQHPDYGKGCLKALVEGPGTGLLEPMDNCEDGSRFLLEPTGAYGNGLYVLRVPGQGCVGIKGSDRGTGTEAVMGQCVGKGGQIFRIEPVTATPL